MTYNDKILNMPQRSASMIMGSVRDFAAGDAYARLAAAAIAAEADAEIARLRAALGHYASSCDSQLDGSGDCGYEGNLCCKVAFDALGMSPGAGEGGE